METNAGKYFHTQINSPLSIYQNSVLNKKHHLEVLGNNYKVLYELIPQNREVMPVV